jgi:simple sugar transport system ATP-binding protein
MMVGRDLPEPPARGRPTDRPVLQLEGVSDGERLGPLDLVVRAGEIVGIAGVEGNGQTELVELLVGVRPCRSGRVVVAGRDLTAEPVGERLAHGIAHIAEDRHGAGVALGASLVENAILGYDGRAPLARRGWLSRKRSLHFTRDLVGRFDVRTASLAQSMATLSGGNQQKLVVGRELSRLPQLLIAAQPTRGLDIGATAFVHDQLAALRAGGAAVLLVSLDLAEVVAVSDRIVVLYGGRIAGEVRSAEADIDRLGAWMTGGAGAPAEAPAGVGA